MPADSSLVRKINYVSISLSCIFLLTGLLALNWLFSITLPPSLEKAGHFQFLTNISLLLTMLYYILNIVNELYFNNSNPNFRKFLHTYHTIVLSLDCVVTTVYWMLKLFAEKLILSSETHRIPLVYDIFLHLFPSVSLFIDYNCFIPISSLSTTIVFAICYVLAILYWFYLYLLMDETSMFPYPFLNVSTEKRLIIFFFIASLGTLTFTINKFIHLLIDNTFRSKKLPNKKVN